MQNRSLALAQPFTAREKEKTRRLTAQNTDCEQRVLSNS